MTRRRSATQCPFRTDDRNLPGCRPGARVTIARLRPPQVSGTGDTGQSMSANRARARNTSSSVRSPGPSCASCSGERWQGLERLPRRGGACSRPTTVERSTHGRSRLPFTRGGTSASWPSRSFLAPARLFIKACGGFTVRRASATGGDGDGVRLCREGHVVVMFPEGTRREKGLRKKQEARWRTGAARIALEAGVPLVPAGIAGTAGQPPGPDQGRLRPRSRSTISTGMSVDDAAHVATDRLRLEITGSRRSLP